MALFGRKPKASPETEKYKGALRPPPSVSGAREVTPLPVKQRLPSSTREALPLPMVNTVLNSGVRSHFVIVSLDKVQRTAKEWWEEFFQSWIESGREFDYVDSTDPEKPSYVVEDSVVLFTASQNEMIKIEQVINRNANMRRAAFTHEVES